MIPLVIIGAGGFGRESVDVVRAINAEEPRYDLLGVVDDRLSEANRLALESTGVPHLGGLDAWLTQRPAGAQHVVAIGDPTTREQIVAPISAQGGVFASLIHPRAVIGSSASIAHGAVICAGVQVSTNVTLGAHTHLNPGSIIGHDAILGDMVSVNPGAIVSGHVRVGDFTLIGAGATILQGLAIGSGAVVGAAACVTVDVEDHTVVIGIPARPLHSSRPTSPTDTEHTV
jgi:sugar O-acyltransferase (sialic acid O-acetyltransferase NeuD family)